MRSILTFLAATTVAMTLAACSDGPGGSSSGGTGGGAAGSGGDAGGAAGGAGGKGGAGGTGGASGGAGGAMAGAGGTGTALTGCESESGPPVSFAADVQPIFQASCGAGGNCHFKALPSGKLSLKAQAAYAALVGKPSLVAACSDRTLVVPGDVTQSYLFDKLVHTGKPDICGVRMPYQKPALPEAQLQTFVSWICQGAKDD